MAVMALENIGRTRVVRFVILLGRTRVVLFVSRNMELRLSKMIRKHIL